MTVKEVNANLRCVDEQRAKSLKLKTYFATWVTTRNRDSLRNNLFHFAKDYTDLK